MDFTDGWLFVTASVGGCRALLGRCMVEVYAASLLVDLLVALMRNVLAQQITAVSSGRQLEQVCLGVVLRMRSRGRDRI